VTRSAVMLLLSASGLLSGLNTNALAGTPFIDILSPPSAAPGSAAVSLTISGADFIPGAVVNFNGAMLMPDSLSASRLHVTVPAASVARAATASVTVINPGTPVTGNTSNAAYFSITPAASALSFQSASQSLAGAGTAQSQGGFGTVSADFNGDGNLDLAISVGASGNFDVLLGDGAGNFTPFTSIPSGTPGDVPFLTVADLNGDGIPDLVFPDVGGVRILFGDGTGSFGAPVLAAVSGLVPFGRPGGLAIADFNGDGNPDIAVGINSSVAILLGDGAGHFTQGAATAAGIPVNDLAAGDFNGDGKLDVVAGTSLLNGPGIAVLPGQGNGSFGQALISAANRWSNLVSAGDFNGDGIPDVAVVDVDDGIITILAGDGTGSLMVSQNLNLQLGTITSRAVVADFNGDGKLDLAAPATNGSILILLGDGAGHFTLASSVKAAPSANNFIVSLVAGDFNGDGRTDVAGPNFQSGTLTVSLQQNQTLSCGVTGVIAGPPKQLQVGVQDSGSGLATIQLESATNADVPIPAFTPGTTAPVTVTATKLDQSQSSEFTLVVTDMAGNSLTCDPVDFTVQLNGRVETHVFRNLSASEHYIRINNGSPGLHAIAFHVNGHVFRVRELKPGETEELNIQSAMHAGNDNRVVLEATGRSGASASILIGDASVGP
jgi:hypothetical protein